VVSRIEPPFTLLEEQKKAVFGDAVLLAPAVIRLFSDADASTELLNGLALTQRDLCLAAA